MSEQPKPEFLGWKKTLVYSLLPLVVLVVVAESGARIVEIWRPPLPVDYGWGFDPESRLFVADGPDYVKTNPAKEVSFPKNRFLREKPPDIFRIAILGGSSVHYLQGQLRGLLLRLAWQFLGRCRFEVINAGGLAYGSHRLVPVLAEILEYDFDVVLVYSGHNEFEEIEQLQFVRPRTLPLQKLVYASAACRFVRDLTARRQISRLHFDRNRAIMKSPEVDYNAASMYAFSPEEVQERISAYRENLSIMIETCMARGAPIVLGTVASNLWKPDLGTEALKQEASDLYSRGAYEEGEAFVRKTLRQIPHHQASDAENEIIRELAREYGTPLADVEAAAISAEPHGIPGETLFSDRCHFNAEGNELLVKTFEPHVVDMVHAKLDRKAQGNQ